MMDDDNPILDGAPRRVIVFGPCGAGKSTLSRRIGEKLGLPVYHIDKLYWKPGWVESSREELVDKLMKVMAQREWVIDGNFSATLPLRLRHADLAIYLDFPRRVYLLRVIKRVLQSYGRVRPDMGEGCPERFDLDFLRFVWNFPWKSRPGLERIIANTPGDYRLIRLRSAKDVRRFMQSSFGA